MNGLEIGAAVVLAIWASVAFGVLILGTIVGDMRNKTPVGWWRSLSVFEQLLTAPGIPPFLLFVFVVFVARKLGR